MQDGFLRCSEVFWIPASAGMTSGTGGHVRHAGESRHPELSPKTQNFNLNRYNRVIGGLIGEVLVNLKNRRDSLESLAGILLEQESIDGEKVKFKAAAAGEQAPAEAAR